MSDEELDYAYRNRMSLPPAERAAIEFAHADMVRRKNRERGLPNPADNVTDNLEAAATPVTPDPALKPRPTDAAPAAAAVDPQAAYEARMLAAGYTPSEARVGAAYESRQAGAFNPALTSDETLRAGAAYMRDQDRKEGALERDLDLAYGTPQPSDSMPSLGPQTEMVDGVEVPGFVGSDGEFKYTLGDLRRAKEAQDEAFRAAGGRRGVPGPRTNDGRPPVPGPVFRTPKEAEQYYARPTDPRTGALLPSPADLAMQARGFVPTNTPDGGASYQLGVPTGQGPTPAMWSYMDNEAGDTGKPAWELASRTGPTGTFDVLIPSAANRAQQDARLRQRLFRNAGIDEVGGDPGVNGVPSNAELIQMARNNRNAEERARKERHSRMAKLAGGSQNLNSATRKQLGMFLEAGNPENNDWQQMMAAEGWLRSPQTMTPLGAEAVGAANAMRMMNAEAFAGGLPGMVRERELARESQVRQAAYDFAAKARADMYYYDDAPLSPADAQAIRRRVRARFGPQYEDVVDALGVEDDTAAPAVPPAASPPAASPSRSPANATRAAGGMGPSM